MKKTKIITFIAIGLIAATSASTLAGCGANNTSTVSSSSQTASVVNTVVGKWVLSGISVDGQEMTFQEFLESDSVKTKILEEAQKTDSGVTEETVSTAINLMGGVFSDASYTFNDDGTGTMQVYGSSSDFSYTQSGNQYMVKSDGTDNIIFTLENGRLTYTSKPESFGIEITIIMTLSNDTSDSTLSSFIE